MTETQARIEEIRGFWNEQARRHRHDLAASTPDPLAKELELQALQRALDSDSDVLEVGCGNGYNLFRLSGSLQKRLAGIDFAPDMITAAREAASEREDGDRFRFDVRSVLDDLESLGKFPQIFTDRCLINLPSLDLQLKAVENLLRILQPGGRLVLVESALQGQERLNDLRERVGLKRIPYHWHNTYLDETEFLKALSSHVKLVTVDHFASLYFLISRVFNAKLTPAGQEPDYLAEINKIACALPSIGELGPLRLYLFVKSR